MKKTILVIVMGLVVLNSYASDFTDILIDYIKHMNISLGYFGAIDTKVEGGSGSYIVALRDGYNDSYYFQIDQDEIVSTNGNIPLGLSIRWPLFYNNSISTGLSVHAGSITNGVVIGMGGVYFEKYLQKFSILGTIGGSFGSIESDLGGLIPAFPGDPGFYDGKAFHEPGTDVTLSGISDFGFGVGVSGKYHFMKYLYAELGVSYLSKLKIDEFSVRMDDIDFELTKNPEPVYISDSINIFIGIGAGL